MGKEGNEEAAEERERMEVTGGALIFQETLQFKTEKNGRNSTFLGIFLNLLYSIH